MRWVEAVRKWNDEHNKGLWCMPRKGTKEHAEVMAIMKGEKLKAAEPAAAAPKMEAPKKFQFRKPAEKARLADIGKKVSDISKMERVKKFLGKVIAARRAAKTDEKKKRLDKLMEALMGMKVSKLDEKPASPLSPIAAAKTPLPKSEPASPKAAKKEERKDNRLSDFIKAMEDIQANERYSNSDLPSKNDRTIRTITDVISYEVQSDDVKDDEKFIDDMLSPLLKKTKKAYSKYLLSPPTTYVSGTDLANFIKSLKNEKLDEKPAFPLRLTEKQEKYIMTKYFKYTSPDDDSLTIINKAEPINEGDVRLFQYLFGKKLSEEQIKDLLPYKRNYFYYSPKRHSIDVSDESRL